MPTVDFYCKKTCKSCQKARAWLDEHGVEYRFVDYTKQLPPERVIREALEQMGAAALRKRHKRFKELKDAGIDVWLKEIKADPNLLGRPILVWPDGRWLMGFKPEEWRERLL